MAQWLTNPTRDHEVVSSTLDLLSGLRIRCCRELWGRLPESLLDVYLYAYVCVYVYRRGTERGRETETGLSQGMGLQSCGSWPGNLRSAGQDIRKGRA